MRIRAIIPRPIHTPRPTPPPDTNTHTGKKDSNIYELNFEYDDCSDGRCTIRTWTKMDCVDKITETRNSMNTAIRAYIPHVLKSLLRCEWFGQRGTILQICTSGNF